MSYKSWRVSKNEDPYQTVFRRSMSCVYTVPHIMFAWLYTVNLVQKKKKKKKKNIYALNLALLEKY